MLRRIRSQKGFTLIELLIVIAIIGIIAALLIPNFLDSLNKARQKNTMATLRNVGTAMMARITDDGAAAAAGAGDSDVGFDDYTDTASAGEFVNFTQLETVLVPQYIQDIPEKDSWKKVIEWRLTLDPGSVRQALAASCGKDGVCNEPWLQGTFFATDYIQDIVWTDGQFWQYPAGTQGAAATP
jgi:prepilin-type N-terminal cleavage/methylation domain-containing protein